jgi:iron complex transport system ATP-binding protein
MTHPLLDARALAVGYDKTPVVDALDISFATGSITALIGPNASGKSTLLRGLSRLLPPLSGSVLLDGDDLARLPSRSIAQRLGILPQGPTAPEGITVADLVARGRHPHARLLQRAGRGDLEIVAHALTVTGTAELAERPVDSLSGGQRQRVWIAMALAQETPLLLLDEPTTYLDIAHQIEVLDLLQDLRSAEGKTIVIVLHDLEQAAAYADRLVVMSSGSIVADGAPSDVLTEELLQQVFGLRARVMPDPDTGSPLVLPRGRHVPASTTGSGAAGPRRTDPERQDPERQEETP